MIFFSLLITKICKNTKLKIYVFQSIFYLGSITIYISEALMRPRDMIVLKHKTPEKNLLQSLLCLFVNIFRETFCISSFFDVENVEFIFTSNHHL